MMRLGKVWNISRVPSGAAGVARVGTRLPTVTGVGELRGFSSERIKNEARRSNEPDYEIPLLYHAGLGLASYGTIYLSMLGFSYIGLEMNFLTCDMVGISVDAAVDQFVKAASSVEPITAETVKNDPSMLRYAQAIGVNRAFKLLRIVMSGVLSIGIAPFVGVPSTRGDYKMFLFIYGASLLESNIEDYV